MALVRLFHAPGAQGKVPPLGAILAVAALATGLGASPSWAASQTPGDSGVSQYVETVPSARGPVAPAVGGAVRPARASPAADRALAQAGSDAAVLRRIATSPSLGASPVTPRRAAPPSANATAATPGATAPPASAPSSLHAVASALGQGGWPVVVVIATVVGMAGAAGLLRRRTR